MSEEEGVFTQPIAAIPSRAREQDLSAVRKLLDLPPVEKAPAKQRRRRRTQQAAVPPKPVKKKGRKLVAATRTSLDTHYTKAPAPPKNPNRPLELKMQLHAAFKIIKELSKSETDAFIAAMDILSETSRSGRVRVIAALAQVYA